MAQLGLIQENNIKEEIPLAEVKFTHSLCIGQTGSGKTTSFIYPNLKNRMQLGHGILFFDIKGSEHLAIKKLADDEGRLKDVVEIGKPWGKNINILKTFNEREFYKLLKSLVGDPSEGGSNTFFLNEGIALGINIYNIFKLRSIILQELQEMKVVLKSEENLIETELEKEFTLKDIYNITYNIDTVYDFIQENKKLLNDVDAFMRKYSELYYSQSSQLYKNIILNYLNLKNGLKFFTKYDVEKDDRGDSDKFETALLSVISTLSGAFGFMASSSAAYISQKHNAFDIVKALQDKKIIIINVRVIPDLILELLLEQVFEELIDLNLQSEEERQPISIFIDEAQRLINKEIPLDVLRSSKVDVLLAVQSELQLISKFNSREDWQQISINIAQKFAFRSSIFSSEQMINFYVDTPLLKTFEYAKEHDNTLYKAQPHFLDKNDFYAIEYKYQKNILNLQELSNNEILFYDVTHFEKEREVIYIDIKTNKKRYKKIFTQHQEDVIYKEIEEYIKVPLEVMLELPLVKGIMSKEKYIEMTEKFNIHNETMLSRKSLNYSEKTTTLMKFATKLDVIRAIFSFAEYNVDHNLVDYFEDIVGDDEREDEELFDELDGSFPVSEMLVYKESLESKLVINEDKIEDIIKQLEDSFYIFKNDEGFVVYTDYDLDDFEVSIFQLYAIVLER